MPGMISDYRVGDTCCMASSSKETVPYEFYLATHSSCSKDVQCPGCAGVPLSLRFTISAGDATGATSGSHAVAAASTGLEYDWLMNMVCAEGCARCVFTATRGN